MKKIVNFLLKVLKTLGSLIYDNKGFILIITLIIFVRVYVITIDQVVGTSMEPTLSDGDVVVVDTKIYKITELDRFDVIVFENEKDPEETYLVKRVIGFPGEIVEIREGTLYINDEVVEVEEHVDSFNFLTGDFKSSEVPENHYFVMGDNRVVSLDSRDSSRVGFVSEESIHGKVVIRQKPIKNIGFVK